MELLTGVSIEKLAPFSKNEKGMTIEKAERSGKAYLLGYRNKGVEFGNHFHRGRSISKNPELLWLISGRWKLSVRNIIEDNFKTTELKAPVRVEIHPNIIHKIYSKTDSIFIEFNSLQEHIDDTEYPD